MTLGRLQQRHFNQMSPQERRDAVAHFEQELAMLALADSPSAEHRRAELQQRIDYCLKLGIR